MPYIEEIAIAGKIKEVHKKYSSRFGKKYTPRQKNKNPTPEEMKRVNLRAAETKLRRLLNTNFKYKDIHLVLTYRKDNRPTPEEARKYLEKFSRKLRTYFKKQGNELKYIAVTEYKNKAIHHHLVINSMDTRALVDMWPHGRPRPTYLDDTGQYGQLASYLIKETSKTFKTDGVVGKRWCGSKNLEKPKIIKRIIKRNKFRKEPKATKGYYLEKDSIVNGIHEITGFEFQFYSMIKAEDKKIHSG